MKVAIDDFGTGYSSLAYLGAFPVDYLKLDKVFTQGLSERGAKRTVAMQIIELAKSLDIEVIAEGAETENTSTGGRGVSKVQGWYFERALSLDKLLDALPVKGGRVLRGRAGRRRSAGAAASRRLAARPPGTVPAASHTHSLRGTR